MSHEPHSELASAYALGALAGTERSEFETHLRTGCGVCETALREYAETLAAVAAELPPVTPPPVVKARLLQRIAAESEPAREAPARRRWLRPLLWGGSLAAAAAWIAYLTLTHQGLERTLALRNQEAASLREEAATLRGEATRLRGEVTRQREVLALLEAPETRVVALGGLPPSPSAGGRMWWHGDKREGFFVTHGLPPVPTGKIYQLWVISGGQPLSAGIFDVDQRGGVTLRVGPLPQGTRAEVFAVTLEPAGGLPAPSGQMYLAGKNM